MQHFTAYHDVDNPVQWLELAKSIQANPLAYHDFGKNKTLCLLFFNPSLRTRLSTQKAAQNLGMNVMVMNLNKDSWQLEFEDGSLMNGSTQEHIREAAAVISKYCDIMGIRTFPSFESRQTDYQERVLQGFLSYATVPVISLESATRHPLQGFTDWLTIETYKKQPRPKVVISWVPHPKVLPQAVGNSFVSWLKHADVELVLTHPEGMDLAPEVTEGVTYTHQQREALQDADFVYVKNWSSYTDYGTHQSGFQDWIITEEKMKLTRQAKFMHCLPVRRNVVATDAVLDAPNSVVVEQAANRTFTAQAVLLKLLGYAH